jgi:hypothetical protein
MPLNFNVAYAGNFPQDGQAAFDRATTTWRGTLTSAVRVEVRAVWGPALGHGLTAITVPNGVQNFTNAPLMNTWYPSALADKLAGVDVQPGQPDMVIFFDSTLNWHFDASAPQQTQLDLESIALHEICHGFGFLGLFWFQAWPYSGSYGNNALTTTVQNLLQALNLQIPFALPLLQLHPSVYGVHIKDHDDHYLVDEDRYPRFSPHLGRALISNNLFFDLQNRAKVYAPNPFVPFTSIEHLDLIVRSFFERKLRIRCKLSV